MDGDEDKAGRAGVRGLLVARLRDAGLKPARGQTEAAVDAQADRLVDRLAYMWADNLETLADCILDQAVKPGPGQGRWPSEITILSMAEGLQKCPLGEKRIVRSWLASVEGPKAEAGGYLVTLYRWLRRHQRPVLKGDMTMTILPQAEEDASTLRRLRRWRDEGSASEEERRWLAAWEVDEAEARAIIDRARAEREAKQQGEGEAA